MDRVTLAIIVFSQLTYRVCCNQCPRNSTGINTSSSETASTANTLLSISETFRNGFFSLESTSYDRFRNDINRIYSGDEAFNEFSFVGTAIHYCREATFLAAFVLTISILLPCMLLILWCLWEKCSDSVDDSVDEEELPNKHLSVAAHVISWILACSVVILLIAMAIFAIILIIGNEKVGVAVTNSKSAVQDTLPTINLLHSDFFKAVNDTLVVNYQAVNDSVYQNELRYINKFLAHKINTSLPFSRVDDTVEMAGNIVTDIGAVNMMLSGLLVFHGHYLETLNTTRDLVNLITRDLASVIQVCNHTSPCDGIEIGLTPVISGSDEFINNNTELLHNISNTVQDIYNNIVNNSNIHNGRSVYNEYVQEIVYNVSESVINITQHYLNPVNVRINVILDSLYNRLGQVTYGLPRSQQLVEQALGGRYVSNWDEFRLLATIAFSLSFFVFLVGVILAIIRGIINTSAIYLYGEDNDYIIGAHMAATTLKSFMTWIAVVGVVSAFFFVFTLCLASLVGRGCGNHGNYSELIDDVIDNNQTWGGVNILGLSYYNDPSHSLTLKSIINSCSRGQSAAEALKLNQLINLEGLVPTNKDEEDYFEEMKGIMSLSNDFYVLQDAMDYFFQYLHVVTTVDYPWYQYTTELNIDLLSNSNTTLDSLVLLLNNVLRHPSFQDSFTVSEQEFLSNIIYNLTSSISLLNETLLDYEAELNKARSNTSSLLMAWEREFNRTPDLLMENDLIQTELVNVVDKAVVESAVEIATNVSELVKSSLCTSIDTLYCETSICTPVAVLFSNFTHATCTELVQGLDIYWATLLLIFITSDIAVVLMITLACHLADKDVFRKRNNPKIPQPYYHSEHVIGQLISIAWLVLVFGIDIWFVVALAMDEEFASCNKQGSTCCSLCYWLFGGMFLLMCALTCLILKVYQLIVLRRIRAYRGGVKAQQVQRYWLVRLRASIFYEGLLVFFLLYIPFTAISGSYVTVNGVPTAPSFASLVVSLFGILTFLVAMFNERSHIIEYLNLLQSSLSLCCQDRDQHSYPTPAVTNNSPVNGDIMGNGGVTNRSDGDIQLTAVNPLPEGHMTTELGHAPNEVEPVEIPVIREHDGNGDEEMEEETAFNGEPVMEDNLPTFDTSTGLDLEPFNENETEEQGNLPNLPTVTTIAEEPVPSILLDGLNHTEGFQRSAIDQDTIKNKGGVRLAHAYLSQQTDGSTPRSSLYMSDNSVNTGGGSELPPYYFHSTSHIPGYTSTDESSYRDDYDSYESDYTTNYYGGGQFDGKQVEV